MRTIPRLMDLKEIELYDVKETIENVKNFFVKYRNYKDKLDLIMERSSSSLSNDNMGIFSSQVSDPTSSKVEQRERYKNYVDEMDKHIKVINKKLTEDERAILRLSILRGYSDEFVADYISMSTQNIYQRKKSCYIKVACYFNIDVEKDI